MLLGFHPAILIGRRRCPGSEKDITEVSGTSSPGSIPGRGNSRNLRRRTLRIRSPAEGAPTLERLPFCLSSGADILALLHDLEPALDLRGDLFTSHRVRIAAHVGLVELQHVDHALEIVGST